MYWFNDSLWLDQQLLRSLTDLPLQGVVKKPRMSCLIAAGPTVTSRGKCCTHTTATFEDAQGLSIMKFFPSSFSFLAFRTMTMIFQKNLVILGWAQFLQIFWVSCVVTGTGVVGRGVFPECNNRRPRALPDLPVQLPVLLALLSWVIWHPPLSANDPPPIFSHPWQIPGLRPVTSVILSGVLEMGWEVMMHFTVSYMKCSENTRAWVSLQSSWIRGRGGWGFEAAPGVIKVWQALPLPPGMPLA